MANVVKNPEITERITDMPARNMRDMRPWFAQDLPNGVLVLVFTNGVQNKIGMYARAYIIYGLEDLEPAYEV